MTLLHDAIAGIQAGRRRRQEIARNLALIAELEEGAVRITQGPAGRCFEQPSGWLLTIRNEQPRGSGLLHFQAVVPLTTEDAEDFYGWSRP